jgi:hypothetical protein
MSSIPPSEPDPPPHSESETTGLPGFRTWRGVYVFVLGVFVVYVVLLAVFARAFR